MQNTDEMWDLVDAKQAEFVALSDRVWETPELNFQEVRSAAEHVRELKHQGFRVAECVCGIPTAFLGEAGEGGPVVAILGEFDALPGLSQEAGTAEPRALAGNGLGHGCGHNLLGAGSLLAATAVKDWLAKQGLPGRVRYYGCPAEEGGAAKAFMARDGAFNDVDVAITWHPATKTGVNPARSLAILQIDFAFSGRAAHASGSPELGRSALDAVELMNVGVNYLREHMPDSARIHYAYLDAGGIAPNVVQSIAVVRYVVRAQELPTLRLLAERVRRVAEGAALMTETSMRATTVSAMSNLVANAPLQQAMHRALERLGPPPFDDQDRKFARAIRTTLDVGEDGPPLCDVVLAQDVQGEGGMGSTDVGDVSWAVPTVQAYGATMAVGTAYHTWQVTAQGKASAAHKGMVHVAKAMAGLARDLFQDKALLKAAAATHAAHLARTPFDSPLPEGLKPCFDMAGRPPNS